MVKKNITSWGNIYEAKVEEVNRIDSSSGILAIGNSNSYGDVGVPVSKIISNKNFENTEKFLDSNLTILKYLQSHKKMLFGIPGKSSVTLGGAVASDVHGKDGAWGGSFHNNIEEISLLTPVNKVVLCSRTKSPEIFWSTVGGFGLTGVVLGIKLKNELPLKSNNFKTQLIKGEGIGELFKNFDQEFGHYCVGWVDLFSSNFRWVIESSVAINNETGYKVNYKELHLDTNFNLASIGKNKFNSMAFINWTYFKTKKNHSVSVKPINNVLFPLSYLSDTRNISKNKKIIQIQFSIPTMHQDKLHDLLKKLIYKQIPILCSIKKLSKNESELNLSFVQEGWTVAVDFSYQNFNFVEIRKFYKELIKLNGKVYLAKDSTLQESEFKEMYENFSNWQQIVKHIDPHKVFQSKLSLRLGLKDW